jgi:RNA polymerase sigma-70 factor (ECF subfamily)
LLLLTLVFSTGESGSVRAARKGDRRAFDTLVGAYTAPLRGFLIRRVGAELADDVMQETWMAAWAAISSYSGKSGFKAWLFGIALHKGTDALRTRGRSTAVAWSDLLENIVSGGPDPYETTVNSHVIRGVLAEMPEAQREVLELYYYAELTLSEIAEILGRNLNTVKYQFYRAHAAAADRLPEFQNPTGGSQP